MDKKFDELFNDFLNQINKSSLPLNEYLFKTREDAIKMIEELKNFEISEYGAKEELDNKLGKPDKIENFMEDGFYIQKSIWKTENGEIVRIISSDQPIEESAHHELSLEDKLKLAIENEEYMEAAKLRDLINKK